MPEQPWTPSVEGPPMERFELGDLGAVAEVTHPIRGRILRRLRLPHSVAELAEVLDVPVTRLYHHVNRLEGRGLIRVVATRRAGAATERRYQVVARSFQISRSLFETLEPNDLAQAMCGLFDLAKLGLQRAVETGELTGADLEERSVLALAEVRLGPSRRAELIQRLLALIADFESEEEGEPMTLFVAAFEEPT